MACTFHIQFLWFFWTLTVEMVVYKTHPSNDGHIYGNCSEFQGRCVFSVPNWSCIPGWRCSPLPCDLWNFSVGLSKLVTSRTTDFFSRHDDSQCIQGFAFILASSFDPIYSRRETEAAPSFVLGRNNHQTSPAIFYYSPFKTGRAGKIYWSTNQTAVSCPTVLDFG